MTETKICFIGLAELILVHVRFSFGSYLALAVGAVGIEEGGIWIVGFVHLDVGGGKCDAGALWQKCAVAKCQRLHDFSLGCHYETGKPKIDICGYIKGCDRRFYKSSIVLTKDWWIESLGLQQERV